MLGLSGKNEPENDLRTEFSTEDDKLIAVQDLRKESRRDFSIETMRLVRDLVLVVAGLLLFGVFVAQPVVVDGESMFPQLENGERLLVNKLIYYKFPSLEKYGWTKLERGDVVVFWYPDDPEKSYVKRLIGFPDETVEMRNGKVLVNGRELNEPYLDDTHNRNMQNLAPTIVKKHHYFVMGDNRDNSADSRLWGLVPEKYIYGKVFFRYWTPTKFGFVASGQTKFSDNGLQEVIRPAEVEDSDIR
jgi:signal peptidase I